MKKIILFAIIIASALSVNSCTTQSEKEENSENSTVVTEIEETEEINQLSSKLPSPWPLVIMCCRR